MKERPILFSAPLVRAILDGRKVVTRRPVKNVQFIGGRGQEDDPSAWGFGDQYGCWHVLDQTAQPWYGSGVPHESYRIACPYGQAGDRLWVRETWHPCARLALDVEVEYRADGESKTCRWHGDVEVEYRADGESKTCRWHGDGNIDDMIRRSAWVPSIHMPRWASRITLEVTSVGVERLQDITEEDARAEGVTVDPCACCLQTHGRGCTDGPSGGCCPCCLDTREDSYRESFAHAWDSIYGAGAWESSPWVWTVSFKVVTNGV